MKTHARKASVRSSRGGGNVDEPKDVSMPRPAPAELTVERIPALVREVDTFLMQTLVATPLATGSSEALDASDEVLQRASAVDVFCQSLRPGPLQEIVGRQAERLREAAQLLRSPSSRSSADLVSMGSEKPRTRSVPIRVTPFMGSALARAAAKKVGVNSKKHPAVNSVRKTATKPLYKWEKRRFLRGSSVAQPTIAASKTTAGRKPNLAEEYLDGVDEARMELHPCSEPGHYSRSSVRKASGTANVSTCFEFQIILTEEEFKALKFQRRRLEAEQRHLARQSAIPPPPAPTAVAPARRT